MIQKKTLILSGQILNLKNAKRLHNTIPCLDKVLKQTKWKKVETIWGCSFLFNQRRCIETLDSNIVKSPHKDVELPNISIPEFFSERLEKFSNYVAVECGITGRKYTFFQLQKLSRKLAVSLLKAGLKPGQIVGVIATNCPEYPIVALACLEAGLVMTTVSNAYTADEIYKQLQNSRPACVIFTLNKLNEVYTVVTKINSSTKPDQHIKLIALDINSDDANIVSGIGRFSQLTADYVDESELTSLRKHYPDPDEVTVVLYSSGTSGLPKGVQLSHNNIVHNLLQIRGLSPYIETAGSHQDVLPAILPFFHVYGLTQILFKSLMYGSKMVTLPKFEPKTFLDMLKNYECTIFYIVPPLVLFFGSNDQITREHFRGTRWIISGAAPLGESDIERCLKKISSKNKISYIQGYGMTETSPIISFPPRDISNLSSVGLPLPNTLVKIIDVKSGKALAPNQMGEVCVKGPQVMMGYLNNPDATAAAIDADGWLHTGDLGHYDDHKFLYITDRIKELIKVKGFQVPPAELEEVLRTMPGIKDVVVIGVPEQISGEVPVAFVVQSPTLPVTVTDVKTFMSKKVAPYKQLAEVITVKEIPRSAAGKLLRREMVKMYAELKKK